MCKTFFKWRNGGGELRFHHGFEHDGGEVMTEARGTLRGDSGGGDAGEEIRGRKEVGGGSMVMRWCHCLGCGWMTCDRWCWRHGRVGTTLVTRKTTTLV
jgi:hypothetical protein